VVAQDQGNPVAQDQGNLVAQDQGNLVAQDQGNLVAQDQDNPVAQGRATTKGCPYILFVTSPTKYSLEFDLLHYKRNFRLRTSCSFQFVLACQIIACFVYISSLK